MSGNVAERSGKFGNVATVGGTFWYVRVLIAKRNACAVVAYPMPPVGSFDVLDANLLALVTSVGLASAPSSIIFEPLSNQAFATTAAPTSCTAAGVGIDTGSGIVSVNVLSNTVTRQACLQGYTAQLVATHGQLYRTIPSLQAVEAIDPATLSPSAHTVLPSNVAVIASAGNDLVVD